MSEPIHPLLARALGSLRPVVLLRDILVTALTVVAAPIAAFIALYIVGAIVGDNHLATGGALVSQSVIINLILFGLAALAMTVATLAILSVNADAHAGAKRMLRRAFPRAFTALPRLALTYLLVTLTVIIGVLLVLPITAAALLTALVLSLRGRFLRRRSTDGMAPRNPWILRFLLLAIPFAPVLIALGLFITAIPASLSYPGSVRGLLRLAFTTLRSRLVAVLAVAILVGGASGGLTFLGTGVAGIDATDGTTLTSSLMLSTLLLAVLLSALMIFTGVVFAVLLPPTELRNTSPRVRTPSPWFLRRRAAKVASTAIVTIVAMIAPIMVPSGAYAATPDQTATPAASVTYATTVQVQLYNDSRIGTAQDTGVTVSADGAPVGTNPTGKVAVYLVNPDPTIKELWVADLQIADAQWGYYIPTDAFSSGDNTLHFVYVPDDPAFLGSETSITQSYSPAALSVTKVTNNPSNGTIAFGQTNTVDFTVTSAVDAADLKLELYDQSKTPWMLIATKSFAIVGGTAQVSLDITGLLATGDHPLYWKIPASSAHEAAESESAGITVTATQTTTKLTIPQVDIGDHTNLSVAVTADNGVIVNAGTVSFFANSIKVGQADVSNGHAGWVYTAVQSGDVDWRVEYRNYGGGFTASDDTGTQKVNTVLPSYPVFAWSGSLTPEDTYVTATFESIRGLAMPTGTVNLTTFSGDSIGSGAIVDGAVRIHAAVLNGVSNYYAVYSGDSVWSGTTYQLLPFDPNVYRPVVTLTGPAAGVVDQPVALQVGVTGVPDSLLKSVDIYRQYTGGSIDFVGSVDLKGGHTGSYSLTEPMPLSYLYVARATFADGSNVPVTTSESSLVAWAIPAPPQLTLTLGSAGPFSAGESIPVTVNATVLPGGGTGVPSGTVVKIMSVGLTSNTEVGTVTLVSGSDGLSGSTTITRPVGGTESLIASVVYGTQSWPATSSPVTLTVAPPFAALTIGSGTARVGDNVTFTVFLRPTGSQKAQVSGTAATFTFDGTTYPLYLDRVNPYDLSGTLQGTVAAFVSRAGDLTASVSVAGDGVNYGALSADATVNAPKLDSTVSIDLGNAPAASGRPLDFLVAATPVASSYAPPIGGTVTVVVYPSLATCTVSNGAWCHLPAGSIVAGDNFLSADYSGDENYHGASTQMAVTGAARQSYLNWHTTANLADAVSGDPLTFIWNVSNSTSLPSQGTVEVTVGTANCQADVTAGTCTLTVPYGSDGSSDTLPITIKFLSADDAPGITQTASFLPKDCVFITVDRGTATGEPGATCTRNGRQGFVTGSYVVAHHDSVAAPYAFDKWNLDGKAQTRNDDFRFLVTGSATAAYTTRYAPVCYTLTLDPFGNVMKPGDPGYWDRTELKTKGLIYALTQPNCSDPTTATTDEWMQLANGKPRYAVGTDVLLHVSPISGEPAYTIDSVAGAEAQSQGSDRFHVVMTSDKSVSAVFKVRDCVPFDVKPGDGGNITVVSTIRPDDSRFLLPLNGSCTTLAGGPGFVPGTAVTLRATPDKGMYFGAWRTSNFGPVPFTGANPLARRIIGDGPWGQKPGADDSRTMTFTVPSLADRFDSKTKLSVGANYLEVQCVAVTTEASWPYGIKEAYSPITYRATDDRVSIDDLRCGPRSTPARQSFGYGGHEEWTQTDWFIGTAVIQPLSSNSNPKFTVYKDDTDGDRKPEAIEIQSQRNWRVDNPFAVGKQALEGSADGPVLDLEFAVDQKLKVNAEWFSSACRKVNFAYPQGGVVTVNQLDYRLCDEGSAVYFQKLQMVASEAPADTDIVPVFSVVDDALSIAALPGMIPAADGRRYWEQYPGQYSGHMLTGSIPNHTIRLEYCVPLQLEVDTRNASGGFDRHNSVLSTLTFDDIGKDGWPQIISDDGGCPPMYARPGSTVHIGLTALGAYGYKIVSADGTGPTITVDKDGSQAGGAFIYLEAICFSVSRGDRVSADTAPNCPTDSSKYVRGTVVQLQADVHGGETFNGWSGVDQSQERYAWVIASGDRSASVDIHKPSTAQKIGNFFSSVAQRIIAVGATIATGLLLAEMALVKLVAMGMAVISTGLHLLGVSGPAMDRFDQATAVVAAPIETVKLFAGCLSSVAHGPDLTDSTKLSQLVASGAGRRTIGITSEQLGKYLQKRGYSGAAYAASGLDQAVDLTNAFGSGSFSNDAATSWKHYGSSIGSCMSDGLQSTLDPVIDW